MEDGSERKDARFVKTERAIKSALTHLMSNMDVNEITVKDVADEAIISKKTFYAHYESIYDLLNEMEDEMVGSLAEIMGHLDLYRDRLATKTIFEKLNALIDTDSEFYGALLRSKTYSGLPLKVKGLIEEKLLNGSLRPDIDREKLSYAAQFIASGIVSVYQQWFECDRKKPLEEVADMATRIASGGIDALA